MSGDVVSKETSDILARIDEALEWNWSDPKEPPDCHLLFDDTKKHIYFLESEIAQLKKACAEWSEVSQHNYQKAKTASLALEAIKAVVKVVPST